jgi:hypothetical protein
MEPATATWLERLLLDMATPVAAALGVMFALLVVRR